MYTRYNRCNSCNNEKTCNIPNNSTNSNNRDICECGFQEQGNGLPRYPILAQAYVPIQTMSKTFCPDVGLKMGTIFPELVRPYMPNQGIIENAYIESRNTMNGGCNNAYR